MTTQVLSLETAISVRYLVKAAYRLPLIEACARKNPAKSDSDRCGNGKLHPVSDDEGKKANQDGVLEISVHPL